MSEIPVHSRPRRLVDWINPTGARKVHSLIDKVYKRKNLEMAWETVKANRGSGGVDGQCLDGFAAQLDSQSADIQFNIGTTLAMAGRHREATAALEQAANMDPPSCPPRNAC